MQRTVFHRSLPRAAPRLRSAGAAWGSSLRPATRQLDRLVAIKVLTPDKLRNAERKLRFVQEAKAVSALNHPNIVTIYDIGSDDGADFIVKEFVAGPHAR